MSRYFTDLSSNNGSFNAAAYASSAERPEAVMIKATEGFTYVNPFYHEWVESAHAHGLAVFHYHFCRPELGGAVEQAEHFTRTIDPLFRRPGDYAIGDLETGTPHEAAAWWQLFDRAVTKFQLRCYLPLSFLTEGNVKVRSKGLHIAAWGKNRPGNGLWHIGGQDVFAWQFTDGQGFGNGPQSIPGVPGRTDGNYLSPAATRTLKKEKKHHG